MGTNDTQWIMDGSGELQAYPDPFRNVTQEDLDLATKAEAEVLDAKVSVELGFAKLAFLLDEIARRELHKALGFETFNSWVESPRIEISKRVARDLIRIRREVVPLLGEGAEGRIGKIGISKVRAMLPLLRDEDGERKLLALTERLLDPDQEPLTWNDVRAEVRRLRGQEQPIEKAYPAIFKVRFTKGDPFYRARIVCLDGTDVYDVTSQPLLVKAEHWPRFEKLFGEFVEEA